MRALVTGFSGLLTALLLPACHHKPAVGVTSGSLVSSKAEAGKPPSQKPPPAIGVGAKEIGPNVFLESMGERRRVLVKANVCFRQGYLEHLLTITQAGKQHESILSGDFDASHIHAALLACGANPGKPLQYVKENGKDVFKPPTGDKIRVHVQYKDDAGKTVDVPAQQWVRENATKKELALDWVFAGSRLFPDPEGKQPPYYGANEGRVICVSNFGTALLDLPSFSSESDADLQFEANSEKIPPLGTAVTVILEPIAKASKK